MTSPQSTPSRARLPSPLLEEAPVIAARLKALSGALDWAAVQAHARPWVQAVRDEPAPFWAMESLLREYPISSAEGLALMRLAEALLRVRGHTACAQIQPCERKKILQLARIAQAISFYLRQRLRVLRPLQAEQVAHARE
jgi:hypothetical protein